MNPDSNNSRVLFLTGCWLISTIAFALIIASLTFFANGSVASWQFPLSFILTGVIYYYVGKRNYSKAIFFKTFLICIGIITVSIVIALNFYDLSYDGQTYHMEGIYRLKEGWNPFKEELASSINLSIYINHYSKGVELPQATIYSLINRIEAAKATNIILLISSFCLCLSYLLRCNRLSHVKCIFISLLAVLNPIVVNQLISTYVDGQLATLVLCFFITSVWIIKDFSYTKLLLLGSIIIIAVNVKFTGLIFIFLFTIALLAWLLYVKKIPLLKKMLYATALSGSIAVFLVGYNPYVINTIDYQHPFYPLMGKSKVSIMGNNLPKGFENKNALSKFFISLFAHTDNVMHDNKRTIQLKIPFTLNKTDISNAPKIDSRIAGFGPLFSGIMLVSIVLLCLLWVKRDTVPIKNLIYFIATIGISVLIIPESWWARYVPQLWYIPLIILITSELYLSRLKKIKILQIILYVSLIFNVSFTFMGLGWNLIMTRLVDYQLDTLKASNHPILVQWGVFNSNRIRFQENNIPFIEKDLSKEKNLQGIIRSNSIFVPDSNIHIPKSNFIKWAEKYQQPTEKQ
jgi:hypothetical protein